MAVAVAVACAVAGAALEAVAVLPLEGEAVAAVVAVAGVGVKIEAETGGRVVAGMGTVAAVADRLARSEMASAGRGQLLRLRAALRRMCARGLIRVRCRCAAREGAERTCGTHVQNTHADHTAAMRKL